MFKFIGNLSREIHHIKVLDSESEEYEPTLVIMDYLHPGYSFQIPLSAMWKYLDPMDNNEPATRKADEEEFNKLMSSLNFKMTIAVGESQRRECMSDIACVAVAQALARQMNFLFCTSWNLAKIMQMYNITPNPQNAAQLLMWIQDGLDDLKNAPPAPLPEDTFIGGEATIYAGSQKVAEKEIVLKESELIKEEMTVQ